jgi:hypothetical protein
MGWISHVGKEPRNRLKFELEITEELEMELLPATFFLISLAARLICSLTMLSFAH